jgi:H/ACA ribonucleoprotein complex non-core subunit NAF1
MEPSVHPDVEMQEPDEARPAKRARLDAPLDITAEVQEEIIDDDEGWDDIYGTPAEEKAVVEKAVDDATADVIAVPDRKPPEAHLELAPKGEHVEIDEGEDGAVVDGMPSEALYGGDERVAEQDAAARVVEQLSAVNGKPAAPPAVEELSLQAAGGGGEGSDTPAAKDFDQDMTGEHPMAEAPPLEHRDVNPDRTKAAPDATDLHVDVEPQPEQTVAAPAETEDVAKALAVTKEPEEPEEHATDGLLNLLEARNSDSKPPKATEDPEFMAAAAAQKDNAEAEWQFDSSDAESSSDDSDDSSDSDSDSDESEGGYELLDPATAAKILMQGEGDDDEEGEGKKKSGGGHGPMTANEQKEVVVAKPDVVITEDMRITELGRVERMVDNLVLVKGATPGEYQVLESGSVLCNEKREVIGAVAETLGRVQEPLYSVAFTNAQEIEEAGLQHGSKVFYVDSHSTFVFTQPLKNMKGTDASNIHDEEVGEDEIEFSDDEAEAEYKRQKKLAKRAARGGFTGDAPNPVGGGGRGRGGYKNQGHDGGHQPFMRNGSVDAPSQQQQQNFFTGGLAYDDDEAAEEFYSPLKRPENLSEMMAAPPPPVRVPQQGPQQHFERGRGRGRGDRGRGRGDRGGRGRGGFHHQDGDRKFQQGGHRGGRGGSANGSPPRHQQQQPHRGNAQSFPDRHNQDGPRHHNGRHHNNNNQNRNQRQHSLPPRPQSQSGSPPAPQFPQQQQGYQNSYQQPQHSPPPQTYQFNGYTFQYGTGNNTNGSPAMPQAPQQAYQQYQQPSAQAGGYGGNNNAAYYAQNQGLPPQPQQQQYQAWGQAQHQPYAAQQQAPQYNAAGAGAPGVMPQMSAEQQANLAELLRRIGGG